MSSYYLTNQAKLDLSEIWNYTFDNWSESQADKYYEMILDSCNKLASRPNSGKEYFIIHKDLLGYQAGKHIIFYRIMSDVQVEITRILHQKMDFERHLKS